MTEGEGSSSVDHESGQQSRTVICEVFRSSRKEGSYLYVERAEGLKRVPKELLESFGEPEPALIFKLFQGRTMARANAGDVLAAIAEQGYYLQLPPVTPFHTAEPDQREGDHAD